ncbi:hypothetical protein [Sporosalibacterium faouarense]|nr:hypothetical protein [Sporosalibacterium faouarense]
MKDLLKNTYSKINSIEQQHHKRLLYLGIALSILIIWNGVCDYIYGY